MFRFSMIALLLSASLGCGAATAAPRLLDFSLPALTPTYAPLDLRRFEGKVTMLLLFEDGCSYCLSMIKNADALLRRNPEQLNLLLIGVGSDKNALAKWSDRVETQAEKVQADGEFLSAIGGVKATPIMLIANRKGEFAQKITGAISRAQLRAELGIILQSQHESTQQRFENRR
jgi:hypothetical protein